MRQTPIMKAMIVSIAGFLMISMSLAFRSYNQDKPWPVPDKYKNMKNPIAADAASISAGKSLWATHCKSCHGTKGLGDGSKAAQLKTEPGDFSTAATQGQSDGALMYKITEGRDDMPSFKKKISDEDDIWNLVNLMRTFKK